MVTSAFQQVKRDEKKTRGRGTLPFFVQFLTGFGFSWALLSLPTCTNFGIQLGYFGRCDFCLKVYQIFPPEITLPPSIFFSFFRQFSLSSRPSQSFFPFDFESICQLSLFCYRLVKEVKQSAFSNLFERNQFLHRWLSTTVRLPSK